VTASIVVIDPSAICQIRHRAVNPSRFVTLAQRNLNLQEVEKFGVINIFMRDSSVRGVRTLCQMCPTLFSLNKTNTRDKSNKKLRLSSRHDFQILSVDVFRRIS